MSTSGRQWHVLIAGAGPTGLVLALWLTRLGASVRIVDPAAEPGTTSRALAVQARTLELYQQMGLAAEVVERGLRLTAVNMWAHGVHAARVDLVDIGQGQSPFPYALDLSAGPSARASSSSTCAARASRSNAAPGSSTSTITRPERRPGSRARTEPPRRARRATSRVATGRTPRCASSWASDFRGARTVACSTSRTLRSGVPSQTTSFRRASTRPICSRCFP